MFSQNQTTPSRPPQRTYGRRSNGKRPPKVEDSDTDTEDVTPDVKRRRNDADGDLENNDDNNNNNNSTENTNGVESPVPRRLRNASLRVSRESTPGGNDESQGSTATHVSVLSTASTSLSSSTIRRAPRRMLSKAQSMAARPVEPSPPTTPQKLHASQSLPITPGSASSQKTSKSDDHGSPIPSLVAPMPGSPSAGRAKRTYGRNRTFLGSEISLDAAPKESYAELRKRYEVDNDDDGGVNELARAPEPISDMRSKGESKRFTDEITYHLSGITGESSPALRRNSSIDILRSMQEDGWVAKMDVHGETERIFDALCAASGNDDVMGTVGTLFLALLSTGLGLSAVLHGEPAVVTTMVSDGLSMRNGPLDSTYKGKVTNAIQRLRGIAAKLFGDDIVPTTRGVASLVLSRMCREPTWPYVERTVTSRQVASRVLSSLSAEVRPLSDRLELYAKGLDIMPKEGVDIGHIEDCLEVLSFIVSMSPEERERIANTEGSHIKDVMAVTVVMSLLADDDDSSLQRQAARCAILALKLLSPLASIATLHSVLASEQNGFITALSRILAHRDRIASLAKRPTGDDPEPSEPTEGADDIASYVLAILGSMIYADAGVARRIAETVGGCGRRSCALNCTCGGETFAASLTQLYAQLENEGGTEVLKGYLHGYLAFLLTQLLQSPCRGIIEANLPGDSSSQISGLLSALRDLRSFRVTAHHKINDLIKEATGEEVTADEDDEKLNEAIAFLEQQQ